MPQTLTCFGDTLLTADRARGHARAPWWHLRRARSPQGEGHLSLHPMWVAWAEVVAPRPPLAPLVRPTMIFVDAISAYRGVLGVVPRTQELVFTDEGAVLRDGHAVAEGAAAPSPQVDRARATELVAEVQRSQIDRTYLLRKPQHRTRRLELLHLPLWCFTPGDGDADGWVVNAVTGQDERFLASRWRAAQSSEEPP